jgi:curli biogenesis system outer membrane secretion channel CsgG
MKSLLRPVLITLLGLSTVAPVLAQKETLAVRSVDATSALKLDTERKSKTLEMQRVLQSLDGHLISALGATRKFSIVGRSDLRELQKEVDLAGSGLVEGATAPAQGAVKGAKYTLITSVDGFLDENSTQEFGTGRRGIKRRLQISAQAKIYDTATSELLEAPNLQVEKVDVALVDAGVQTDGKRNDEVMPALARELAEKIAARTVDVVFPAKVIDKEDKTVTINRGDGMPIKVGETWQVFGPTKVIKDPDSGAEIKRKGKAVGKVRITSVEPTYSQAEIIEDTGITVGAVLSRIEVKDASAQ